MELAELLAQLEQMMAHKSLRLAPQFICEKSADCLTWALHLGLLTVQWFVVNGQPGDECKSIQLTVNN